MTLNSHLFDDGPKHILTLDGGGVRGVVALAFLERIEELLSKRYGTGTDFRLCDHYALIGGTSTGAMIATGLALGYSVQELLDVYVRMSSQAFSKRRWFGGIVAPKFPTQPLLDVIDSQIGNTTLGSDQLRCGLGIVTKRLDTNSVWVFHNHPRGPFFDLSSGGGDAYTPNKDLPLANLIRASTAAPTYFEPEFISIAPGTEGAFVDGGVSPHNDPALAMFMLATLHGYGFRWPTGIDNMSITSVGTGAIRPMLSASVGRKTTAARVAFQSIASLMLDCSSQVQTFMQWMGSCRNPAVIDSEIGDLAEDCIGIQKQFKYTRLNITLDRPWLKAIP